MKHEFKPGDQVLIVGATTDTKNIGKSAELIELVPPYTHSKFIMPNGLPGCHDELHPCWLLAGDGLIQNDPSFNGFGIRAPGFLMPLRGDENPDAHLATSAPRQAVTA